MQPNQQQGYYRPEQNQPPAGPVSSPPTPAPAPTPPPISSAQQPVQPVAQTPPQLNPAAQPQTLNGPAPVNQAAPQPLGVSATTDQDEAEDYTEQPITWTAHEYIHQEKGTTWFIFFVLIILALLAVSIFLMKSISFAVLLAVIAVAVFVYTRRPPRELTYSLNDEGLVVDGKLHKFSDFKSFGVIHDGEEYSIMLIPTRRFQPAISVYFPEEAGEDIVDMLGSRLPMKDLKLDAVDRVVRLLRL